MFSVSGDISEESAIINSAPTVWRLLVYTDYCIKPFFPSSQMSQAAQYQEDKPERASNEVSPMLTPSPNRAAAGHDAHSVNDAEPLPSPGMPLPVQISDTPRTVAQQIHVASGLELQKYSYLRQFPFRRCGRDASQIYM
ncbi:hypothetical protein B0H13DRAFT_2318350 [Mycena leptocephala]|jgi:hypothetical protein|nr:hypothetical protein B0H13DRAFT_2318350 [Mycena leptocephala]